MDANVSEASEVPGDVLELLTAAFGACVGETGPGFRFSSHFGQ